MATRRSRTFHQGKDVPVQADTLCVHGDQPGALAFVRRIRAELAAAGIEVRAPAPGRTGRVGERAGAAEEP